MTLAKIRAEAHELLNELATITRHLREGGDGTNLYTQEACIIRLRTLIDATPGFATTDRDLRLTRFLEEWYTQHLPPLPKAEKRNILVQLYLLQRLTPDDIQRRLLAGKKIARGFGPKREKIVREMIAGIDEAERDRLHRFFLSL